MREALNAKQNILGAPAYASLALALGAVLFLSAAVIQMRGLRVTSSEKGRIEAMAAKLATHEKAVAIAEMERARWREILVIHKETAEQARSLEADRKAIESWESVLADKAQAVKAAKGSEKRRMIAALSTFREEGEANAAELRNHTASLSEAVARGRGALFSKLDALLAEQVPAVEIVPDGNPSPEAVVPSEGDSR